LVHDLWNEQKRDRRVVNSSAWQACIFKIAMHVYKELLFNGDQSRHFESFWPHTGKKLTLIQGNLKIVFLLR